MAGNGKEERTGYTKRRVSGNGVHLPAHTVLPVTVESTTTRNEQAGAVIDAVAGTVLTNLDLSCACCSGIISNLLFVKYSQVSNGTIDVGNIVVAWLLNICFFCSLWMCCSMLSCQRCRTSLVKSPSSTAHARALFSLCCSRALFKDKSTLVRPSLAIMYTMLSSQHEQNTHRLSHDQMELLSSHCPNLLIESWSIARRQETWQNGDTVRRESEERFFPKIVMVNCTTKG